MNAFEEIADLLMQLRDEEKGCDWCRDQDYISLNKYLFEEAHELQLAIQENDPEKIKHELADILFQPFFYAQMASEKGDFNINDVAQELIKKLRERNPHVFGDESLDEKFHWQKSKREGGKSILDSVDPALPPTIRSDKIQTLASSVNFDWENAEQLIDVLKEEIEELAEAIKENHPAEEMHKELGDILFTCVNMARHLKTDVNYALNLTNEKFIRRFQHVEAGIAADNLSFDQLSFDEMLDYWNQAKDKERNRG